MDESLLKRLWRSNLFLLVVLVALGFLTVEVARLTLNKENIGQETAAIRRDLGELEKRNQRLSQILSYLKTPEFTEREAKAKLNLKKPGEDVFAILPGATTSLPFVKEELDESTTQKSLSNPAKWWRFVFH